MTFITVSRAKDAARVRWGTEVRAIAEVKKSANAPIDTIFDVFISHSYEDADVIAGVKAIIEGTGLSAYVDWIEDAQLDRSQVSPATADQLRKRMNNCRFLLFVTSSASPHSKWMPWELGYFDGLKRGKVGIFPIVKKDGDDFHGQEYLGLYPLYQEINFRVDGRKLGRYTAVDRTQGELLEMDVRRLTR